MKQSIDTIKLHWYGSSFSHPTFQFDSFKFERIKRTISDEWNCWLVPLILLQMCAIMRAKMKIMNNSSYKSMYLCESALCVWLCIVVVIIHVFEYKCKLQKINCIANVTATTTLMTILLKCVSVLNFIWMWEKYNEHLFLSSSIHPIDQENYLCAIVY